MKTPATLGLIFLVALVFGPAHPAQGRDAAPAATVSPLKPVKSGYAPVNGLKIYYEIYGAGRPLVLLHGGGSTIDTSFAKVLPAFAATRQVIAFEQQGHGRTADVERPFTFEQSADDAAALLSYLKIDQADVFGWSNGGSIALQMGLRRPQQVRKLVAASAMFRSDGLAPELLESLKHATPESMPPELREAYLKVAPHPEQLPVFVNKCVQRMLTFKDWSPEVLKSIQAPTLVLIGDTDVIRTEHAVAMSRLLPHSQLAVLPGTQHDLINQHPEWVVSIINTFLDAPLPTPAPAQATTTTK